MVEQEEEQTERLVDCAFLGKQAPGLREPPLPGELGIRIYESISKEAWQQWLAHQTMLINEYQLQTHKKEHLAELAKQAQNFLFGINETAKPKGFRLR